MHVADVLAERIGTLPEQLRRSLTWDQGRELSEHKAFSIRSGVNSISAIRGPRGSAGPTRTPTACCASTSPVAWTSPAALRPSLTRSPISSTAAPAERSRGEPGREDARSARPGPAWTGSGRPEPQLEITARLWPLRPTGPTRHSETQRTTAQLPRSPRGRSTLTEDPGVRPELSANEAGRHAPCCWRFATPATPSGPDLNSLSGEHRVEESRGCLRPIPTCSASARGPRAGGVRRRERPGWHDREHHEQKDDRDQNRPAEHVEGLAVQDVGLEVEHGQPNPHRGKDLHEGEPPVRHQQPETLKQASRTR